MAPDGELQPLSTAINGSFTIKDGELFLLMDERGEIPSAGGHGLGLYLHDMRFLSAYTIRFAGVAFLGLGANSTEGGQACLELGNPPLTLPDGTDLDKLQLGARYERKLEGRHPTMIDQITLFNYTGRALSIPVEISVEAGFRDIFQVRGLYPEEAGDLKPAKWQGDQLLLCYGGLDSCERRTRVSFSRSPEHKTVASANFTFELPPRGRSELTVRIQLWEQGDESLHTPPTDREARYAQTTSESFFVNKLVDRSFADLKLLLNRRDQYDYYAAGLPWFAVVFGRDSLLTAMMSLPFNSALAESTLRLLAALQGRERNPHNEEEPGRILHELRCGELARGGKLAKSPDYGTVDATPLFLMLLCRHARWTGHVQLFQELRESAEAALSWIDERMDRYGGWLSYKCVSEDACNHQGWKDVDGGIVRADGTIVQPPVALVEVQGMVHEAWRGCAELYRRIGEDQISQELALKANRLKKRFAESFWLPEDGYLALALEGERCEPVRVVTSNMGQALWTGVVEPAHARQVADLLLDDDNFSGWGVRTLSAAEKAYCPIGYHSGGVWPHDNALIAAGLKHYGFDGHADRVIEGIIKAAFHFPLLRLPELFCGFPARSHSVPVAYPTACSPQAWAAASVPGMLATALGLEADAFENRLTLNRPRLPAVVPDLKIRHLRVGNALVDLSLHREGEWTEAVVDHVQGDCEVFISRE